jgi:hypothetical protein
VAAKFKAAAFRATLLLLALSCVIFPNSLKILAAISLIAAAAIGLPRLLSELRRDLIVALWLLGALVSLIYMVIGQLRGAPAEAAWQVALIYGLFPILWITVTKQLLACFPLNKLIRAMTICGVICCGTVAIFYYLFLTIGPEAVAFFIEEPNIETGTEGYIGATMYVFGTLIFLTCGFIAAFDVQRATVIDCAVLLIFMATAFVAGRSALLLALFVGAALNLFHLVVAGLRPLAVSALRVIALVFLALALVASQSDTFGLDPVALVSPLIEKVLTAGGEGRMQQLDALATGIAQNWGLGAGHGVGVHYTVSDQHPWRYEMVWLASVYRVGVIGAAVYALPFILTLAIGLRALALGRLQRDEMFLYGGFLGAFIASNTNPYVEALVFQWMYVLPTVYFVQLHAMRASVARRLLRPTMSQLESSSNPI